MDADPDIAAVAGKLTKAQVRLIVSKALFRGRTFYGPALVIVRELEREGIMRRPEGSQFGSTARLPTPLGLALRQHLLENGGG